MKKRNRHKARHGEHTVLAAFLADLVDLRHAGEAPSAEEYSRSHPELADEIRSQLAMINLLESARSTLDGVEGGIAWSHESPADCGLSTAIAELPERDQRLVYLRLFLRQPWQEIAAELGGEEEALQREHAGVLRRLIERCEAWLSGPGGGRSESKVSR